MKITESLFSAWHDSIVEFVKENENALRLFYCLAYLQKINDKYNLGLYKSKCNYIIDRNEVMREIKEVRKEINK